MDRKQRVDAERVDDLEIPGIGLAGLDVLAPVVEILSDTGPVEAIEEVASRLCRQAFHLEVVKLPGPSPARPTPNGRIAAEIVAVWALQLGGQEAVAGDHADPRIVAIPFQQLGTEPEESGDRHTIVFEQDRLGDAVEHPGNTARHAAAAAEIDIAKIGLDLARPVY